MVTPRTVSSLAMGLAVAVALACEGQATQDQEHGPSDQSLVGQLILPPGTGSRGVEVIITLAEAGREPRRKWLLFDDEGRFTETLRATLTQVTVSTGLSAKLYRIGAEALPQADAAGRIDLGVIDLRQDLFRHRLVVRAGEGAAGGKVRMALCFGLPPVGPQGEPISLGSRQFPDIVLGGEVEWLLPLDAVSVYFLVERSLDSDSSSDSVETLDPTNGRKVAWRSGRQQLFGPFTAETLPAELVLD